MALVGEGFSLDDANRGEDTPAANESRLAGREANLLDRKKLFVVEDVAMNHERSLFLAAAPTSRGKLRKRPTRARNANRSHCTEVWYR